MNKELYEALSKDDTVHGGCANKTWTAYLVGGPTALLEFLTGKMNDIDVDSSSDSYETLSKDWYWESVLRNDFLGAKSNTMENVVRVLGLECKDLTGTAPDLSEESGVALGA